MTAYPSIGFPLPYILFSLLRTPQLNLKIAATTVTEWIYCPPHGATTGLYWILPTYWKVIMLGRCVIIAWLWLLLLLLQAACGCPSLPRDLRLIYKYYHTSKPYPWFSSITISQHHSAGIPGSTAIWICSILYFPGHWHATQFMSPAPSSPPDLLTYTSVAFALHRFYQMLILNVNDN